jgi:hypothetical protein
MPRRPSPCSASIAAACLAAAAAAVLLAPPAYGADVNIEFSPASYRALDKSFWDPVDHQDAFGGMVDMGRHNSHLHFAVGFSVSGASSNGGDFAGSVSELFVGFVGAWQTEGRMRGYVGAGPSFVGARYEIDTPIAPHIDDTDDAFGAWFEGGVAWRLGNHFSLGVSGRALTFTNVNLFGVNGNANYWQLGPLLSWSWPRWKR